MSFLEEYLAHDFTHHDNVAVKSEECVNIFLHIIDVSEREKLTFDRIIQREQQ